MTLSPAPIMLMVRGLGPGGTERQMTELARALHPDRFEVHVGCFDDQGIRANDLRERGIPILRLGVTSFLKPHAVSEARRLAGYLRKHSIRIVHTFDHPLNNYAVPVARFAGVPVALSSQRGYRTLYRAQDRAALRVSDRIADGIVVNCEAMRRHLAEDCGAPARKIDICYNGVNTAVFRPGARQRTPALDGASLVIGTVCVLRPEKGLPLLLGAFAKMRAGRPGVRLAIVGSGPELPRLMQLARDLGIAGECHFEPATAEVPRWLRSIDIFALPSQSEAFSNSLLEAAACGCCSVASDAGGNPELVRDGETGLLFPKADADVLAWALGRLAENPGLRARLAEAAARRVFREFTIEQSAARMQQIYNGWLNGRRSHS